MQYQCYIFNRFRRIARIEEFTADTDEEACAHADAFQADPANEGSHKIELWQAGRRVNCLEFRKLMSG
jgi:hypothetical protein